MSRAVLKNIAAVGAAFGVSSTTYKEWQARGCPGSPGNYDLVPIRKWLEENRLGPYRPARQQSLPLDDDDEHPGANSPALERLREAKAAIAEIDLARTREQLVSVDDMRAVLDRAANILKECGERLSRRYGPDCQEQLAEAASAIAQYCNDLFGGETSRDTADDTP